MGVMDIIANGQKDRNVKESRSRNKTKMLDVTNLHTLIDKWRLEWKS